MTYDELQQLIADYLERDLADDRLQIQSFIRSVESKINRLLRVSRMTQNIAVIGVTGQQYYDLPADFLTLRAIKVNNRALAYVTPVQLENLIDATITGDTRYYTLQNDRLRVYPTLTEDDSIDLTYYQRIPALSATNASNWLLADAFDLYYYGALAEAERYYKNDQRVALWDQDFASAIASMHRADKRDRHTATPARIRVTA